MKFTILHTFLFISIISFSQPSYVPQTGLVAWFPLNGNAEDESSNSNSGTVNGATLTLDRFGNINSAYNFNGTSNFISVPDNVTLDFANQFSISLWLFLEDLSVGSDNERVPIGKQRAPNLTGFSINAVSGTYQTKYASRVAVGGASGGPTANESLSPGTWEHLVVVYNGQTMNLYRNGELSANSPTSLYLSESSQPLFIGKEFNTAGRFFKGKIDDIGLWNRPLSEEEIAGLFSAVITTVESPSEKEIVIYPNPAMATQVLHIDGMTEMGGQLKVVNLLGQTMYTTTIKQSRLSVDTSEWPVNSSYFISIFNKKGEIIKAQKIIFQ